MGKGRKLTTSQSERFLGSYGSRNAHGFSIAGNDSSELGEDDVWSTVDRIASDDGENSAEKSSESAWDSRASVEFGAGSVSIPIRRGGGGERNVGGLSVAFETMSPRILHHHGAAAQSPLGGRSLAASAPVNVPEWSKIYRVDSVESLHDSDDGIEESEMVPPHEYLARGRRTGGTSVFEGVGRTLKGRDLRRVRDAVWSQTGFDG